MTDVSKKPSDRIHELAAKHAPPIDLPWGAVVYGTNELVKGLIDYLDECHEKESRRLAVLSALALCVPGGSASGVNKYLEQAGMVQRVAFMDHAADTRIAIVNEAKAMGLL